MAKELTAQTIFTIVMILIMVFIIANFINSALKNVSFWLLRPSESAALDLVGYITALGGTSGKTSLEYKVYTSDVTYHVKRSGKLICIIAKISEEGPFLLFSDVKTYNCYSTPFDPQTNDITPEGFTNFYLKKYLESNEIRVEMD
jgi:hypothetical protein